MADPLALILEIVRGMMIRHITRLHNRIRRRYSRKLGISRTNEAVQHWIIKFCVFKFFFLENCNFFSQKIVAIRAKFLKNLSSVDRSIPRIGDINTGKYADSDCRWCPWGDRFIYEKHPGQHEGWSIPTPGRVCSQWAAGTYVKRNYQTRTRLVVGCSSEGFIGRDDGAQPRRKFYSYPPTIARRHLDAGVNLFAGGEGGRGRKGRFRGWGGGGAIFQFRQTRRKYCANVSLI